MVAVILLTTRCGERREVELDHGWLPGQSPYAKTEKARESVPPLNTRVT
jgi:hypothetical protein